MVHPQVDQLVAHWVLSTSSFSRPGPVPVLSGVPKELVFLDFYKSPT